MQLGRSWLAGSKVPLSLPDEVLAAISTAELYQLTETAEDTPVRKLYWTLTFLESKPILELDNGWLIYFLADGSLFSGLPEKPGSNSRDKTNVSRPTRLDELASAQSEDQSEDTDDSWLA